MGNRCRVLLIIFFLSGFLIPLNKALAVGPTVSEIRVSDVTTRSFSVVWITSEPSTASLLVYDAPACNILTTGINITGVVTDSTGVIKVSVTGLSPATTYCFQTSTTSNSTPDTTVSPSTPQLVTTETQTTRTYMQGSTILPFGNDLIYHPVLDASQNMDSGSVLMISVDGSSFPVSTWSNYLTGSNISMPGAILDLNNVFSAGPLRENMNLNGGERMRLIEVRGTSGCTLERWRKVPLDDELVEIKLPAPCFSIADINCDDIVEIGDIILDINGYGTYSGSVDSCFNPDLDQNDDGFVEIGDIILVIGQYGTSN